MRAWEYEKKLKESGGGEVARRCWEEIKRRAKDGNAGTEWEEERQRFYEVRGWGIEEVERLRGLIKREV